MVTLKHKQAIILDALNGISQREIAAKYAVSRNTVRKYVNEYQESKTALQSSEIRPEEIPHLTAVISEKPKYNTSARKRSKLTSEVLDLIKSHLEQNEQKKTLGIYKQQKKAIDIYESLAEEGVDISYTTVCAAVRSIRKKSKEAYIKQEYNLGDVCEFDWGEVKLLINDTLHVFQMGAFTSAKGNYRFAKLYHTQKMECFLDIHVSFFKHIGGNYKTVVYDNMRTAVKRFVTLKEKEPTEDLLKLSLYYGFQYRFCNARSGNEKGHVERSVEYIRRKAFSKKHEFASIEEANIYLKECLEKLNSIKKKEQENKSPTEILQFEKEYLLPAMPPYGCHRTTVQRVNKYSATCVDQNYYSVPDWLVDRHINVFVYPEHIEFFYEGKSIAMHKRLYGSHLWSISIFHYTRTLKKKPGALAGSTAMKQTEERLQEIYNSYYKDSPKDFIVLIEYIAEVGSDAVFQAVDLIVKLSPTDVTTDKIKIICSRNCIKRTALELSEVSEEQSVIKENSKQNIERINTLFGIQTLDYKREVIL